MDHTDFTRIGENIWEMGARDDMRVPLHFFCSPDILKALEPQVFQQAANVARLPGIVRASMAMPDAHWGYGFPIGGVAAFDPSLGGVISVGGVGFDISCGVRTMRSDLVRKDIRPHLSGLADELFKNIPAGLGSEGPISLSRKKLDELLVRGAEWAVANGFGYSEDLEGIEDFGRVSGGDPDKVSKEAKKRQTREVGTLGSGNHYLEVQYVEEVFDHFTAEAFGLFEDQVLVSIHCGSRGLGHQIGTDYIQSLGRAAKKYDIPLPERELVCAPLDSPEGRDYFSAMCCGINCALANRQVLCHLTREVFGELFPGTELPLLYDVSHNTCKVESHAMDNGGSRSLYIHRKGATRAFGPGRRELPERYRKVGQPVIIGGTMGTSSFILAGAEGNRAWSSACHGAGRMMSRRQATKRWKGQSVIQELARQGILIRAASRKAAAEEAPQAYKDVAAVVEATRDAGLARPVARVKPMACIKG
jgi:tRNA-splicing ligase RtcB